LIFKSHLLCNAKISVAYEKDFFDRDKIQANNAETCVLNALESVIFIEFHFLVENFNIFCLLVFSCQNVRYN